MNNGNCSENSDIPPNLCELIVLALIPRLEDEGECKGTPILSKKSIAGLIVNKNDKPSDATDHIVAHCCAIISNLASNGDSGKGKAYPSSKYQQLTTNYISPDPKNDSPNRHYPSTHPCPPRLLHRCVRTMFGGCKVVCERW